MELRTFIKTALLDIVRAVQEAQDETDDGTIVPETHTTVEFVNAGVTPMQFVDFEVAVRADESKGVEAKLGVVSAIFGAGVGGSSSKESGHASIIKFRVPIGLPTGGTHGLAQRRKKRPAAIANDESFADR